MTKRQPTTKAAALVLCWRTTDGRTLEERVLWTTQPTTRDQRLAVLEGEQTNFDNVSLADYACENEFEG